MSSNIAAVPVEREDGNQCVSLCSTLRESGGLGFFPSPNPYCIIKPWKICNFLPAALPIFLLFTAIPSKLNQISLLVSESVPLSIISVEPAVTPYSHVNLLLSPLLIFPGAVNKLRSLGSWNDCMSLLKDWNSWRFASDLVSLVLFCHPQALMTSCSDALSSTPEAFPFLMVSFLVEFPHVGNVPHVHLCI